MVTKDCYYYVLSRNDLLLLVEIIKERENQGLKGWGAAPCGRDCWFEPNFIQVHTAPSWKTHFYQASSKLRLCDSTHYKIRKCPSREPMAGRCAFLFFHSFSLLVFEMLRWHVELQWVFPTMKWSLSMGVMLSEDTPEKKKKPGCLMDAAYLMDWLVMEWIFTDISSRLQESLHLVLPQSTVDPDCRLQLAKERKRRVQSKVRRLTAKISHMRRLLRAYPSPYGSSLLLPFRVPKRACLEGAINPCPH